MNYTYTKEKDTLTAIHKLVGGNISGNSDGTNMAYDDGQTPPSEAEIDAELVRLQTEYDNDYARKRQEEYPTIEECVHAILDNDNNELDTLQAKRAEIKLKYPKGG